MVRVISIHHFTNQFIQIVEQPTACTVAPPNRLLLALMSNCVEVRDLNSETNILFSFPTVDEVSQIVHCLNGDYVATLETKFNRQNKELSFVRVYINWDSVAALQQSKMTSSGVSLGSSECGMVQPMRARIAGRVTPTTNQSELGSLEMIEIPVKRNPNAIECCQVSGNLLILSDNIINIHLFKIKTHDISKIKFIDFEEVAFPIELSFIPIHIGICENYISCFNRNSMYLFKVLECNRKQFSEHNINCVEDLNNLISSNDSIDYNKLVQEELHKKNKDKITVNLPTIVKENSMVYKNCPFMFHNKDLSAVIKINEHIDNKIYKIENLIQLTLTPVLIENAQRQVTEEFKSIILKPLYTDHSLNKGTPDLESRFLRSDFDKNLNSIVCIVATQQEGYLYYFDDFGFYKDKDNCLAIYPFTAPVFKLVMEENFLHALTETGLETYTLRYGHQMCRNIEIVDNVNVSCPLISDPVCLVGLRPFLGVEQILLSDNFLVLLANSETSPTHSISSNSSSNASFLTLYSLELPSPITVFNDICIVANTHRFTSVTTYCHLMSEAHMILRISLLLKKWSITEDSVKLVISKKGISDDVADVYRISCALLGDHYIMEHDVKEYSLAIPYYKMARIQPIEVFKRIKKIQEQSGNFCNKGFVYYLKKKLLDIKTGPEADKLFGSNSKQFFSESVLQLLVHHSCEDLSNLILKSKIMREYSTDKLISILTEKLDNSNINSPEKHLALAMLYIQKSNINKAQEHLEIIINNFNSLILENHDLLFEVIQTPLNKNKTVTFSELSVLLITLCPELLASIFVTLMLDRKVISLSKMVKVFLEYLPSSIGNNSTSASLVLQKTLENYFEKYFSKPENIDLNKIVYERGTCEALKLLVRSYLSQIQMLQLKVETNTEERLLHCNTKIKKELSEDENDDTQKDHFQEKISYNRLNKFYFEELNKQQKCPYLFSTFRYEYLEKMPPFQVEITSKLYEATLENYECKEKFLPNDEADQILKKLQALLCSNVIPKQIISEVNGFLSVNDNLRGNLSLRSITMNINDVILLLIDSCPQCLLQFARDRFSSLDKWKFLVATIQRKILKLSQNENLEKVCFFYKKILRDVLTYSAASMTLDQLIQVFPERFSTNNDDSNGNDVSDNATVQEYFTTNDLDILNEIQNYEPYITICKETMHANQMKQLITATGHQLLLSLSF